MFAFVSPTPLWKNLSTASPQGAQNVNVTALQTALKKQGYYKKAVTANFTSATKKALKRWQKANGIKQTGVVDVTKFVWMPTGSVLTAWSVGLGSHVSSGTALASVVSPSRLSRFGVGQPVRHRQPQGRSEGADDDRRLHDRRLHRPHQLHLHEPASSSSSATGSSSSTQYSITISPRGLPKCAKSGMTGTLAIVLKQASGVLMVPTSAVSGTPAPRSCA